MNRFLLASALVFVAQAQAASPASASTTLRLVQVVASDGSIRLTMTNLDDEGRRLGGELTEDQRRQLRGDLSAARNQQLPRGPAVEAAAPLIDTAADAGYFDARPHTHPCGCFLHGRVPQRDPKPVPRGTFLSAADRDVRAIDATPYTRGTARQRNKAAFRRN